MLEKDIWLAPKPRATTQPTKVDYHHTRGSHDVAPTDRVYVVGVRVPLHQQNTVALDQLRQRHLGPMDSPTPTQVQHISGWTSSPTGPPPSATVTNIRAILHPPSATVPHHDLVNEVQVVQQACRQPAQDRG